MIGLKMYGLSSGDVRRTGTTKKTCRDVEKLSDSTATQGGCYGLYIVIVNADGE